MNRVEQGPYPLQISDGLDFYKNTMSQVAYEQQPNAQVTFELTNRGKQKLGDYVSAKELQARLDCIGQAGFSDSELLFLGDIQGSDGPLFAAEYLAQLRNKPLPTVNVHTNDDTGELAVTATGDWWMVTFWETIVMSELNEAYFEAYCQKHNLALSDLYEEGDARLTEKIERLKAKPGIQFADFGTRRHFSYRWQRYVVERLANELPDQFLGTSNVGLAKDLGLKPIGTFAHEMPMVYTALAYKHGKNIRTAPGQMFDDWYERYDEALSTVLTDTYGSDFFFIDFGAERAAAWKGVRHDSGDPIAFGEKVITFYKEHGIDPTTKKIVFSDGLDIDVIEELYEHFNGRIQIVFGWGTTLMNDLGIKPNNVVMKAVAVDGVETVKLSDVATKHTGSAEMIEVYEHEFSTITTDHRTPVYAA